MRAGQLRHRITIEHDVADPDNPGPGGVVAEDWQPWLENEPAEVIEAAGAEIVWGNVQVKATTTHAIRMRFRDGTSPEMRVIFDGRTLGITSARDKDGRRRELIIECEGVR